MILMRPCRPIFMYVSGREFEKTGGLYAFRISAHNAAGWSAPSQPSSYRRLDAVEPPPRPIAPVWAVPSDAGCGKGRPRYTRVAARPDGVRVRRAGRSLDVQRCMRATTPGWMGEGDRRRGGWAARTIDDLDVERKVVARVRARNAAGLSAWSGASPPGHVTRAARPRRPRSLL